jgi:hypothetical protein
MAGPTWAATPSDKATVKAAVAAEAGVPASAVKNFALTSTLVAARRSLQAKASTAVANAPTAAVAATTAPAQPMLRKLASYAWTVSCDISVPLSSTAFADEAALTTSVWHPSLPRITARNDEHVPRGMAWFGHLGTVDADSFAHSHNSTCVIFSFCVRRF